MTNDVASSVDASRTDEHGAMLGLIRPGTAVGGVDLLRCGRAPGASTYIRQLRDGLPQSCMHSSDDRGDGFTLFAGARDANRILELPVAPLPDPAGPEALKKPRDYAAAAMCGVVLAMTAPSGTKPVST